jgi:hypothetical protein
MREAGSDKMKVYLVYRYDRCDYERTNLKVYKNEEDAKKWCQRQPHIPSTEFDYDEIEAEGF